MLKVISFQRTSEFDPAQWEGKLSNGQTFYVRYRSKHFTCHVPKPETYEQYETPLLSEIVDYDDMTTNDMIARLRGVLDFSQSEWVIDDI